MNAMFRNIEADQKMVHGSQGKQLNALEVTNTSDDEAGSDSDGATCYIHMHGIRYEALPEASCR